MIRPVVLLVHAAPQAVPAYESALGLPVRRIYRGGYSASYDGTRGLASEMTLDEAVDRYAPGTDPRAPVVLVGFSAGCWALRHWLRDPAARARVIAAVMVDGYHAGGDDGRASLNAAHEGVIAFARSALVGHRTLIVTHSQIVPPGYASTRATASALLAELGIPRGSYDTSIDHHGMHVIACAGDDGPAHSAQLLHVGPDACREHVVPALAAMVADTDPAPPMVEPEDSLQLRALEWCLLEAEDWGDRPVPRERIAEYSAGCVRNGKLLRAYCKNFCAAAQGFAESQVAVVGEQLPPWRAGAREPMHDARAGLRGAWYSIADVLASDYRPPPGSLAVYWRVSPGDWRGHIERVIECGEETFSSVGANESGGRWVVDESVPLTHPRLLGFVVDEEPAPAEPGPLIEPPADFSEHPLDEQTRAEVEELIARTIDRMARELRFR